MKSRRLVWLLITFILCVCLIIPACGSDNASVVLGDKINIVLAEQNGYTCTEPVKTVKKGEDAVFDIVLSNGYDVKNTTYADYKADISQPDGYGVRTGKLHFYNLCYPSYIELQLKEVDKIYRVEINRSDVFTCSEPVISVSEGREAVFMFECDKNFVLSSCDYAGEYSFSCGIPDQSGKRAVTLRLLNVSKNCSVELAYSQSKESMTPDPIEGYATIGYSSNGGCSLNGGGESVETYSYSLKTRTRPNTEAGFNIFYRDGYTMTGWNTEADLSGEHIGFGSKYSVGTGEAGVLFAEWEKCADTSGFEYDLIDASAVKELYEAEDKAGKLKELVLRADGEKCAVLTKYTGNAERLVIPEQTDGYPVAAIFSNFYDGFAVKQLILPHTVKAVFPSAFEGCFIETLHICDSLAYFDNTAMKADKLKTLYINAATVPVYGASANGQFANKVEAIIANEGKKRVIFFGSCSTWYGLDEETLSDGKLFINGEVLLNAGIIGGTCALSQINIINNYINRNDKFIYLIEAGSDFQLLLDFDLDSRIFIGVENNYDLLSSLTMTDYTNVLPALSDFLYSKKRYLDLEEGGSYDDVYEAMNEHGFLIDERFHKEYEEEYSLPDTDKLNDGKMISNILKVYRKCRSPMYFAFGPLSDGCVSPEEVAAFDATVANQLALYGYSSRLLCNLSDCILPRKYFYDTSYHLTTEGAVVFSEMLLQKMKEKI